MYRCILEVESISYINQDKSYKTKKPATYLYRNHMKHNKNIQSCFYSLTKI